MTRTTCCTFLLGLLLATGSLQAHPGDTSTIPGLPPASPEHLPRWRGFNLTDKFHRDGRNGPFREDDFRFIHELGFNFVRLPMDYRVWIRGDDWNQFNEASLKEIDQAVNWGAQYGIHVCVNFHRAPGYTVASPPEKTSLWTDAETQRVCAKHWAMFARRYYGIPNERLSFNLFNEPANVDSSVYVEVVRKIVAAIRAEDPDRLIISDGLGYGREPILELADLRIAQATRGYTPTDVTHYMASWIAGADQFPLPAWPRLFANGTLYVPTKAGLQPASKGPLVVEGPFDQQTAFRIHLQLVTSRATLAARADGNTVWQKSFVCGPGTGEWKQAQRLPEWNIYQNTFDRDYVFQIPARTQRVELSVMDGDWLRLSEVGVRSGGSEEHVLPLRPDWDRQPAQVRYRPTAPEGPFVGDVREDREWLKATVMAPWEQAQARRIGVMVGEFGCFNRTPRDVTLRWMEDCLQNWQEAGWGWALWNFRGSFGVLDSGRTDVQYEDFHGHQLDRKMLDLLQRY